MTPAPFSEERFWKKGEKTPSGCLEWTKARDENGYGRVWFNGVTRSVSRVAYMLSHGDIPDGLIVRHKCDNPPCFNPDHLLIGTFADNGRDRKERNDQIRVAKPKSPKNPPRRDPKYQGLDVDLLQIRCMR